MTESPASRPPLLRLLASLEPALRKAQLADPVFLGAEEKRVALLGLHQCVELLRALELRVLGVAELGASVCEEGAFRDVVDLHAHTTRSDRRQVARDHRLAAALEHRWSRVAAALQSGACAIAQAEVIVHALETLPDDLAEDVLVRAEEYLLSQCGDLTPDQLRRLGRAVLQYVAPQVADAEEARQLEREEQRARDAMSVHVRRCADGVPGLSELRIKAPDAAIDRFATALDAYTSPRHLATAPEVPDGVDLVRVPDQGERVPYPRRRAFGFLGLLEALDPHRLPLHGGDATTLIVTIPFEQLVADLGVAELVGGERISAAEARRLACTAGLLPMVLGGASEPLDLGRSERLYSPAQRKALSVRDRQCRAEGCTIPAAWCEAHHRRPWSEGGPTDLADGALLCAFHHHRAHDARYDADWRATGEVSFRRQRDPAQWAAPTREDP